MTSHVLLTLILVVVITIISSQDDVYTCEA